MEQSTQVIRAKVTRDPTILLRVLQVMKRRRININKLVAEDIDTDNAEIMLDITATTGQVRLISEQINKLVDVIDVDYHS